MTRINPGNPFFMTCWRWEALSAYPAFTQPPAIRCCRAMMSPRQAQSMWMPEEALLYAQQRRGQGALYASR